MIGRSMPDSTTRDAADATAATLSDRARIYAHIVEASPSGLLKVAADGRITLVNRHIETMFGP